MSENKAQDIIALGTQMEYILTEGTERLTTESFGNNRDKKQKVVLEGYDIVKISAWDHSTPADADAYALTALLPQVIAAGGVFNASFGHKIVTNTTPIGDFRTYLSFPRGNRTHQY